MNIEVSNHMSTIDGETIGKLDSLFKGNNQEPKKSLKSNSTQQTIIKDQNQRGKKETSGRRS